jgi:hypothetical protein
MARMLSDRYRIRFGQSRVNLYGDGADTVACMATGWPASCPRRDRLDAGLCTFVLVVHMPRVAGARVELHVAGLRAAGMAYDARPGRGSHGGSLSWSCPVPVAVILPVLLRFLMLVRSGRA